MSTDSFIKHWYKIDMALFRKYKIQFCCGSANGTHMVADFYLSSFRLQYDQPPGQGNGSRALKLLCRLAVLHEVSIGLQCSPQYIDTSDMTYLERQSRYWRVVNVYNRCGFRLSDIHAYRMALKLWPCNMDFNLPKKLRGSTEPSQYELEMLAS